MSITNINAGQEVVRIIGDDSDLQEVLNKVGVDFRASPSSGRTGLSAEAPSVREGGSAFLPILLLGRDKFIKIDSVGGDAVFGKDGLAGIEHSRGTAEVGLQFGGVRHCGEVAVKDLGDEASLASPLVVGQWRGEGGHEAEARNGIDKFIKFFL